jgi:NADH-quinone oxidoreductase subunit C
MNDLENLQPVCDLLVERHHATLETFRGEVTAQVSLDQLIAACLTLRDELGFEMLIDETAVDFWPQEKPRFHLVCQLRSIAHNQIIALQTPLDGNEPVAPSLTGVYPNADWYERELWDLFGIHFTGHPDLRRILMPHDWTGHPLRKDYPLGYEEPQFTFNYEKIQARKLNPKD